MTRSRQQVLDALASAARLSDIAPDVTWADALFAQGDEGWRLSPATEPDRALLATLATEVERLDAHAGTLPDRLRVQWLQDLLRIPRLPVVADRVIVAATVEPKLAPGVVPRGTLLRGGKDAFGNERRYRTVDALTAFGAQLEGVRVTVPGGPMDGEHGHTLEAPNFPVIPPDESEAPSSEHLAPHVLRISSPLLAFTAGSLGVKIDLAGAAGSAVTALCKGAKWRYVTSAGTVVDSVVASADGTTASMVIADGCMDPDGGVPWIEAVMQPDQALPIELSFTAANVQVARSDLVPDAAYANDGALPHTKEFEPFGITAKVGDAFYVRCDEALSKPLQSLIVSVEDFPPPPETDWTDTSAHGFEESPLDLFAGAFAALFEELSPATEGYDGPVFEWQAWRDSEWTPAALFKSTQLHYGLMTMEGRGSDLGIVGGQEGRFVRAQLQGADLGWRAYQQGLADFATDAVHGEGTMPPTPVPLQYQKLRVTYTTTFDPAPRVESLSGWRHSILGTTLWSPFRRTVDGLGATGMVAFGVLLADGAAGSSFSLYVDLVSPSPCGSSDPATSEWQWWDGSAWQKLLVADGTNRMRESGLLRFVVPDGWAEGCSDVTSSVGKWLRFITNKPEQLGEIRAAIPDAVVAEFVSTAADPQQDPSPATALPAGTIKGPLAPISGIKKMTNLASVRGRGPEVDAAYLRRASAHVRHRGRAVTQWDFEQIVSMDFPEIAAVHCLPHTNSSGLRAPGYVGVVLIPDQRDRPAPRASVSVAGRVREALQQVAGSGAHVAILCPSYKAVEIHATISLRAGVAAIVGRANVLSAIETFLHPLGTQPVRWGQTLYASSVIAMLERLPEVDLVENFAMFGPDGAADEIHVDRCLGLYCSSAGHQLSVKEKL